MRSRVWLGALLTLLTAALLLPVAAVARNRPADTVFKNGYIYTVNAHDPVAKAVAVKGGKIVYVGSNRGVRAFVGPSTQVVRLGGKMMLPGFIDSHMHASMTVSSLYSVLLYGMTSVDEYVAAVAEFAGANPEMDVIRGQGWSNTVVPGIGPLATALDAVVSDKPVAIMSEDGHSYWVNSAALALADITGATPDPENGVIERVPGSEQSDPPYGTPSGTLRETAADLVTGLLPDYTVQQYKDGVASFQQDVAAPLGLTTVFDPLMYVGSNGVQALEEMASDGDLTVRFRAALSLTPEDDLATWIPAARAERAKHRHGMFKTPAVKIFADGVVEGHTAYLDEPYADALEYKGDAGYRGEPIWRPLDLKKAFARLDRAGFQIHTHAIGDAATTETLNALAYARKVNGKHDWRPGITHLQLVDPKDFSRFAKLGVTAVPDPYWFIKDDYYTYLQVPYLGLPRADREYPMKSFFRAGVTVASASDFPVTIPPDPLMGIAVGVTRWAPDYVYEYPAPPSLKGVLWPRERATVEQMIRSFTINGARANYLGRKTGSIKVGKRADLVVLDTNLLEVAKPTDLFDAHVLYTMGGGKVLHDAL
jgi:predicted amidohydrolase YtcJ